MAVSALRTSTLIVCILACATALALVSLPVAPADTQPSSTDALTTSGSPVPDELTTESALAPAEDVSLPQTQLPNTLTIVSTGNTRVYYNATASGHIQPGAGADLANAKQPDTATNTTASGSTAQHGVDNFTFTGRITALTLTGGPAHVFINGQRINPATIPATTSPATNTTAYLTIPANVRETASYQRISLNVPSTLALDTRGLEGRFQQLILNQRFSATDTNSARRARLRATTSQIETRIDRLRERKAAVIAAYNSGSMSAQTFLRELALIDAAADRLATAIDRVVARARSVPRSSINGLPVVSWAQNRHIELGPLQGPVSERLDEALQGNNTVRTDYDPPSGLARIGPIRSQRLDPLGVYIETSSNGVVLATIDDGQYYRETYLTGERNATGSELTGSGDVLDRVRELYPWAANNSGSTELNGDRRAGISRVTLFHDHGRLTVFLNQSSGRVFAEHQRKTLSGVPTTKPVIASEGNLRLQVNRTYPTGPLEISLATPTGEPIDGTVTINGQPVGQTGTDGQLWTIAPHKTVTIGARANSETIRIQIPTRPRTNHSVRVEVKQVDFSCAIDDGINAQLAQFCEKAMRDEST